MKASSAGLAVRLVPIRAAYSNGLRDAIQGVGFQTETLPRSRNVSVRGLEFFAHDKMLTAVRLLGLGRILRQRRFRGNRVRASLDHAVIPDEQSGVRLHGKPL